MRRPDARDGLTGRGVHLLSRRLARVAASAGLAAPEAFAGLDGAGHFGTDEIVSEVRRMGATGARSAELVVHPGADPDYERHRYRWGYDWSRELAAVCSSAVREEIHRSGFVLGRFSDLIGPVK